MAIPRILHLTSDSTPLRGLERRLLIRNRRVLRCWEVRVHSDTDNDALVSATSPEYSAAFRSLPHGVMRADVARLLYMHAYGGWYADTDYEWLNEPADDLLTRDLVLPLSREGTEARIGNAVFGSAKGHPFWLEVAHEMLSKPVPSDLPKSAIERTTGPERLSGFASLAVAQGAYLVPRRHFHGPTHVAHAATADVYGIHHTRGSWRDDAWRWKISIMRHEVRRLTHRRP